jgi:hypothetical protein
VRARLSDRLGQRRGLAIGRREHGHVEEAQRGDMGEVGHDVVGQGLEHRDGQGGAVAGMQQRVAVGFGARCGHGGDDQARAGPVVHEHRLAERIGQPLSHGARGDVADAARAVGHQVAHGPRGELLRAGGGKPGRACEDTDDAQSCGDRSRARGVGRLRPAIERVHAVSSFARPCAAGDALRGGAMRSVY